MNIINIDHPIQFIYMVADLSHGEETVESLIEAAKELVKEIKQGVFNDD